jgi:ABC-type branched-subunit amino acid transport system substrate-binding protein
MLTGAAALVAMACSAALLTACGTPTRTNSSPMAACGTSVPGVTAKSIKIGLIYPDSGPAELAMTFTGVRSAVDARIALQNAHGGVRGRTIDLVWQDDQSDAGAFAQAARNLVDTEQVFGLIALTVQLDASAKWLADKNVPVTGFASSVVWNQYPNLFHYGNLFNKSAVTTFGDYVKAQGGTKALIVVDPTAAAYQNLAANYAASLRSRGIQVLGNLIYNPKVSNLASVAEKAKESGADTLIGTAQAADFIDIYTAAKSLGANFNVALNSVGYSTDLLAQRGSAMAGMSLYSSYPPPNSPAMMTYYNAMRTYAPELADPSDEIAVASYVAADEMIQGLELAGVCPTRDAFIHNLRQMKGFTGSGLIAPVDLSDREAPVLCEFFAKVDSSGRSFTAVAPPAPLDRDGYWCGQEISGSS